MDITNNDIARLKRKKWPDFTRRLPHGKEDQRADEWIERLINCGSAQEARGLLYDCPSYISHPRVIRLLMRFGECATDDVTRELAKRARITFYQDFLAGEHWYEGKRLGDSHLWESILLHRPDLLKDVALYLERETQFSRGRHANPFPYWAQVEDFTSKCLEHHPGKKTEEGLRDFDQKFFDGVTEAIQPLLKLSFRVERKVSIWMTDESDIWCAERNRLVAQTLKSLLHREEKIWMMPNNQNLSVDEMRKILGWRHPIVAELNAYDAGHPKTVS